MASSNPFEQLSGRDASEVVRLIDSLKAGLFRGDNDSGLARCFTEVRMAVTSHPALDGIVPAFLIECRDLSDVLAFQVERFPDAKGWEAYVRKSLNGLANAIEQMAHGFSNYRILSEIGRGGYGCVYRVRHKLIEEEFAVKVLQPVFGGNGPIDAARFFQEAKILYALNHPNIIRVYEVGQVWRSPYIVMELFDGEDLGKAIRRGRLTSEQSLAIVRAACEGLQHSHELGILHRDIKPSNILVGPGGDIRLIDFGLGIFVEMEIALRLTQTGQRPVAGRYTAPELLEDQSIVDTRSDIFSIGAIWFEMVTGRAPVGANLAGALRVVDGLPQGHQDAILRCLDNQEARFPNCKALLKSLGGLASDGGVVEEE